MPPFKLHRHFRQSTGLTPGRYVERCRLHQAAVALALEDASVTELAAAAGYRRHETFTRAFRRLFGCAPSNFRQAVRWAGSGLPPVRTPGDAYALSATRPVSLRTLHIACLRHHGPYECVPDRLWQRLIGELAARGIPWGRFLGIGHDDPARPPPDGCRFDAAVQVTHALPRSVGITVATIPARAYAVTTHVGAYGSLGHAMPAIVAQVRDLPAWRLTGLPVIEVYRADVMDSAAPVACTDVYLPIQAATA